MDKARDNAKDDYFSANQIHAGGRESGAFQSHLQSPRLNSLDLNNIPVATPAQQADFAAHLMKGDIVDAKGGLAHASEAALSEVNLMLQKGLMKNMAADLEKDGSAKVERDKDGNPTHLIFGDKDGSKSIDVDVNAGTVNNKNADQLHKESIAQAKEFNDAKFNDGRIKDLKGKEISPEARKALNELNKAMLDGDSEALSKAGKNILQNPALTQAVGKAMESMDPVGNLSFIKDEKGQPHIKVFGTFDELAINKDGKFETANYDYGRNQWKMSEAKEVDSKVKEAANFGLYQVNEEIASDVRYLEMTHKLPVDGRSNMKSLERADWGEVMNLRKHRLPNSDN